MARILSLEEEPFDRVVVEVARVLKRGGLAVFPTDTVYGLAASVRHYLSIERIFYIKGRDALRALVVMVGSWEEAASLIREVDLPLVRSLSRFWPGALTVVAGRKELPWMDKVAPQRDTLGLRVPDHRLVLDILGKTGPLAVTSANLSGGENPARFDQIPEEILQDVDIACKSEEQGDGVPSSIVEVLGNRASLLREGRITRRELERHLGMPVS